MVGAMWYMWGGMSTDESLVTGEIAGLDMRTMEWTVVDDAANTPYVRNRPSGVVIKGDFCFMDTHITDTFDGTRQVWCWAQGKQDRIFLRQNMPKYLYF